jgi:hypothetical protein
LGGQWHPLWIVQEPLSRPGDGESVSIHHEVGVARSSIASCPNELVEDLEARPVLGRVSEPGANPLCVVLELLYERFEARRHRPSPVAGFDPLREEELREENESCGAEGDGDDPGSVAPGPHQEPESCCRRERDR